LGERKEGRKGKKKEKGKGGRKKGIHGLGTISFVYNAALSRLVQRMLTHSSKEKRGGEERRKEKEGKGEEGRRKGEICRAVVFCPLL